MNDPPPGDTPPPDPPPPAPPGPLHPDSQPLFERPVEESQRRPRTEPRPEESWLPSDRPRRSRPAEPDAVGGTSSGSLLGIVGGILLIPVGLLSPVPILVRYLIVALGVVLIVASASGSQKAPRRAGITIGIMLLVPVAALVFLFAVCTLG
jgi:hypothetical protein